MRALTGSFVTGYEPDRLGELVDADLSGVRLAKHGATRVKGALYRIDYSLSCDEIDV